MKAKIIIDDHFERSSIDYNLSYVAEEQAEESHVFIYPRRQTSEDWVMRWLEPCFRLTNIKGKKIIIHIKHYNSTQRDQYCHQLWKEAQRGHYSYDFHTWHPLSEIKICPDEIILSHHLPFLENSVFFARSWPRSVTIVGENILSIKEKHKELIHSTETAKVFQPKHTLNFPAQEFIANEIRNCTDELGRAVPHTPFYSFEINDQRFSSVKRNAIVMGGVHAGEDVGDLALWEYINWLLGNSLEATEIRKHYIIRVYPMINAPGRFAGYWRTSPESVIDTNRQWGFEQPDHHCIQIAREVITKELNKERLIWGLDFHSAPSGDKLQIACRHLNPNSVTLLNKANQFMPDKKIGVYGDINSTTPDTKPAKIAASWMRIDLKSSVSVTVESCEQTGPLSPNIIRPYVIALGKAIYEMHQESYFDNPQPTL